MQQNTKPGSRDGEPGLGAVRRYACKSSRIELFHPLMFDYHVPSRLERPYTLGRHTLDQHIAECRGFHRSRIDGQAGFIRGPLVQDLVLAASSNDMQ